MGRKGRGGGGGSGGGGGGGNNRGGGGNNKKGGGNNRGGNRGDNRRNNGGGGGGGGGRGGGGGNKKGRRQNVKDPKWDNKKGGSDSWKVSVYNMPKNHSVDHLISFLSSKTNRPFHVSDSTAHEDGTKCFLFVEDKQDAMSVKKLNGIIWFGNKLSIQVTQPSQNRDGGGGGMSSQSAHAIQVVENNIHARYNNIDKLLNLGDLSRNLNVKLDFNNSRVVTSLFQMLQRKCGDVISIILSMNNIKKLEAFSNMTQYLPHVRNINFQDNQISDFRELDHLSNLSLNELLFRGNPIAKGGDGLSSKYHLEVGRRFPTLTQLDGENFKSLIQFDVPESLGKIRLPGIKGSYCQNASLVPFVQEFLTNFFSAFDNQKDALLDVYIASSLFSLSCSNMSSKPNFGKNKGEKGQRTGSLAKFEGMNRNLMRLSDLSKREEMIHKGKAEIITAFKQFPDTTHSLDSIVVDVLPLACNAVEKLSVTVHGYFWDHGADVNRSFDRILILCRGGLVGLSTDMVVLNDILHVREYLEAVALTPVLGGDDFDRRTFSTSPRSTGSMTSGGGISDLSSFSGTSISMPSFSAGSGPGRDTDPVRRLAFESGMKEEFARECFEKNGCNYDAAWADFVALNAEGALPDDVFGYRGLRY